MSASKSDFSRSLGKLVNGTVLNIVAKLKNEQVLELSQPVRPLFNHLFTKMIETTASQELMTLISSQFI